MSGHNKSVTTEMTIAQMVKKACIQAAKEGFQDASMSGLCSEGAIEAAIGAIQSLNVEKIIEDAKDGNQ